MQIHLRIITNTLNTFQNNSPVDRPGSRKTHSPLVLVEKHHQKLPRSETQSSKKLRRSSSTAQLALRLRTVHPTHRWKP